MARDIPYFGHDYDAASDERLQNVLMRLGVEGYGLYWRIVESLYQNGGRLAKDYALLAFVHRVSESTVRALVEDFGLFYDADAKIASRRVDSEMESRSLAIANARKAGKASASQRAFNGRSTGVADPVEPKEGRKVGRKEGIKGAVPDATAPFRSEFCTYNDRGQPACDRRREGESRFCPDHKLKVRELHLTKSERGDGFSPASECLPTETERGG